MANEKILVVDDDKNICELLRLYLVKEGYNVTMVHDGGAALAAYAPSAQWLIAARAAGGSLRRSGSRSIRRSINWSYCVIL